MGDVKATLLFFVNELEIATKKPVGAPQLSKYHGVSSKRVSPALFSYADSGELKKTKSGTASLYKLTPMGKQYLDDHQQAVMSLEAFKEWASPEREGGAKPMPLRNYSAGAVSAIDAIANLVDQNEKLMNTIRVIHAQLSRILEGDNNAS